MTKTETVEYYYPNRMGRMILLSMEEVMGRNGVHAVLKLASLTSILDHYPADDSAKSFSFATMSRITDMLEQVYGPHGGRGLALRIGRACFNNGIRQYGGVLGVTEMAFRMMPMPVKLVAGAKAFAQMFNSSTDQIVRVEEDGNKLLWVIERCPLCWERRSNEPICHLAVGVLQESLYWLSGGKVFNVEEKTCVAMGDAECVIAIDRTPVN